MVKMEYVPVVYSFGEFKEAVGAPYGEPLIRQALEKLGLRGIPTGRKMVYRPEWVEQVRDYLDKRARGEA